MNPRSWLRGLRLLGSPTLVQGLGELDSTWRDIAALRAAFPGAFIHHDAIVQGWPQGSLRLADRVRIEKGAILCLGSEYTGYGALEIGEHTWIGQYNNFRLSAGSSIRIGRRCLVSQFCSLVAANHGIERDTTIQEQPTDTTRTNIEIGDDVWLGAGSCIMPAVTIGTGAVIGAGSVVTAAVPEYEIWAGVPARKIGQRT